MSKRIDASSLRPAPVALAVCAAFATLSTASLAEPLQQVTLYRNADMSRWSDNYVEFGGLVNGTIKTINLDIGFADLSINIPSQNASYKFGEFSGLNQDGSYGTLGFNWITRQPDDDSKYSQVYGENLGLASSKFLLDAGHQGHWRMTVGVDRLTRSETDSASFVHQGLGTDQLTMPTTPTSCSSFDSANNTTARANDADIANCLRRFDIKQEREIYRFGFGGLIGRGWDYQVSLREDRREGTRLTGMLFGQAVVVPYVIDDRTQQFETSLSFTSKAAQLQLSYLYSRFRNEFDSFTVENPFRGEPPSVTNTPSPTLATVGRMSLMPSNDFHQVNALGGYNLSKTTRLTTQASYSVSLQNEAFRPYSEGLVLSPTSVDNTPDRTSLDGKLVNSLLDVALTSRPIDRMNVKLGYQYRNNDNQTPSATYTYVSRDTAPTTAPSGASIRKNVPASTREQKVVLDGDYEIARRTLLRAVFERSHVNYEQTDRTYTDTSKATLELRRPVSSEFLGNVGYTFTQRKGSDYDKSVFFLTTYPTFGPANLVDNHPSLRSFMYSDYNENRVRAGGTWTASEVFTLQGGVDGFHQRYRGPGCNEWVNGINATAGLQANEQLPDTCLGRTMAEGGSLNLDFQWRLEENLATFAFGNLAQTRTDLRGRSNWARASAAATPTGADVRLDYLDQLTYRDTTLGVGVNWQPEKWDLGAQYIFNRGVGKTEISLPAGSTQVPTAVPETENRLHSVQLYAKWNYSKESTWRFNYWIERLMSSDWAYDRVVAPSATPTNYLSTGQSSPNYWNHVVGISYAFTSW